MKLAVRSSTANQPFLLVTSWTWVDFDRTSRSGAGLRELRERRAKTPPGLG